MTTIVTLQNPYLIHTVYGLCVPSCSSTVQCTLRPIGTVAGSYNRSDEDIPLDLVFFSPFEELRMRTAGIMESKGIHRVYEPSPVPTLYVGRVDDLLGRVPLIPCSLGGNATSTIPHKYSSRQRDAFECSCADGAGPTSRRGSHVYDINAWLWKFGRPQPRVGGLSVAKIEKIRRKSRSDAAKRAWPQSGP